MGLQVVSLSTDSTGEFEVRGYDFVEMARCVLGILGFLLNHGWHKYWIHHHTLL